MCGDAGKKEDTKHSLRNKLRGILRAAQDMKKDVDVKLDPLKLVLAYQRDVREDRGMIQCGEDHFDSSDDPSP